MSTEISSNFYNLHQLTQVVNLGEGTCLKILHFLKKDVEPLVKKSKKIYTFTDAEVQLIEDFKKQHENDLISFLKKQTYLERYGVENYTQTEEYKRKTKETCLKKYGVENPAQSKEAKEAYKKNCLEKYGVESTNQMQDVKEKKKRVCLEKYGVENVALVPDVKKKKEKTCLEKYGCAYAIESSFVREKAEKTCLEKYGVENYTKTAEYREKTKETCMERYGVESYTKAQEFKDKSKITCQEKYGAPFYVQSGDFKEKARVSCLTAFGVEYPSQSKEIKEKIKKTCLEKYGVEYATQSNEVKDKMQKSKQLNIEKIEKEYDCVQLKKLVDLYGQGWLLSLDIPKIRVKSGVFISNSYREQIEAYSKNINTERSFPEEDLATFCRSVYSGEILYNTRKVIPPFELDIYIPEKKLAIEFNGTYFHSQEFGKDKKYHENKSKLCEEQGIRLIHIYECEWRYSKEKIKSLLRLALGTGYSKIGARQCEVRQITNKEAEPFNDINHLQSHKNARITYGLFYNGELQQLMSFSHHSKYQWEIVRGCPGSNNQVVGGVSKLFKAFVRDYNPDMVFSYCDFNKFDGKGYEALGMRFIGYTGPDKFYVDKSGAKVMRNPKKREELEESCNFIIWGSGSKKYLWTKAEE